MIYSKAVHRIRDKDDLQDWIRIRKNMRIHGTGSKNIYKNCKKNYSQTVGSVRFWLPGIGSAKIGGSTDPDPKGKISTKNCKKKFTLKPQIWTLKKREIIKISWFLNSSSSFSIKISEKRTKNWKFCFIKKIQ